MREGTTFEAEYVPPDEATWKFHSSTSNIRVLEGDRGTGTTTSVLVELFMEASRKSTGYAPVILALCTRDTSSAAILLDVVRKMGVPLEKNEQDKYYTADLRGTKVRLYFATSAKRLQGLNLDVIAIDGIDSRDEISEWITEAYLSRHGAGTPTVLVSRKSWDLPTFRKPDPLLKIDGVWRANPQFRGSTVPGGLKSWIDMKVDEGAPVDTTPRINFDSLVQNTAKKVTPSDAPSDLEVDRTITTECYSLEPRRPDTDALSDDAAD